MKTNITRKNLLSFFMLPLFTFNLFAQENPEAASTLRLPDPIMPQLGCWFWRGEELVDDGYKKFIDQVSVHSPYKILTTSFRFPEKELTDEVVHRQVELATEYARQKGIGIALDLDVRLARRSFFSRYPGEMQEMLILKETLLEEMSETEVRIHSKDLNDHYTGRTEHYVALKEEVKRIYIYNKTDEGITGSSLVDIEGLYRIKASSPDSIVLALPPGKTLNASHACVLVSFTHLSPAVFAPHLISYQRELLKDYSHVALAGVCKDEWGFPPCFYETFSEFWYSDYRASAYAERTGGRELLEDCVLMSLGIEGKEKERMMAINHFRDMSLQRNAELEDDFYWSVKEIFGPYAYVGTHPTWYPYPGFQEFKKNGLHWWASTRDWAQTDEVTPFGVRTALSKKWGSAVWHNMYYAAEIDDYNRSVWSHALGGGRINYHPLYPNGIPGKRETDLMKGDLMKADCRIRLLNYISKSPLDCPVAVVFGHASAMNWAGPGYGDVGMTLVDTLWASGIPTDLIPSSEIQHLKVDEEGWITYGPQKYAAVVLYNPEYESQPCATFFQEASGGKTQLMRMGNWTKDFQGEKFDGTRAIPESMAEYKSLKAIVTDIHKVLKEKEISLQSKATDQMEKFGYVSNIPPASGHCRLIDGTLIQVAGSEKVSGDPIVGEEQLSGQRAYFDAMGLTGIRLDAKGEVEALAAGGLKSFRCGNMEIELKNRIDLALWKSPEGEWEGVVQGLQGEIPAPLLKITDKWSRLLLPQKYADAE